MRLAARAILAALLCAVGSCKSSKAESTPEREPSLASASPSPKPVPSPAVPTAAGDAGVAKDPRPVAPAHPDDPTAPADPLAQGARPDAGPNDPTHEEEQPEDLVDEAELTGPLPKGVTRDKVVGGTHYKFRVAGRGNVHVWVPRGYRSKEAGIVVYVHGYGTTAGRMSANAAWGSYGLAEQFKDSRQNAVFIVCDAPSANEDPIRFPKLSELLRATWKNTHLSRPPGPLVVIGHSGAFRTIAAWLEYRPLAHVIMLDGLFGFESKFVDWLEKDKGHENHKLTMIGQKTAAQAAQFLRHFNQKTIVRLQKIPAKFAEMPKGARTARILYIRSQYGHMQLVTSKKVIPVMLRRTPLKPL